MSEPRIKHFHRIFCLPPSTGVAEELVSLDNRFGEVVVYKNDKFPDGNFNFHLPKYRNEGIKAIYIASHFENQKKIYKDLTCIRMLSDLGISNLTVVIPFMGSATNERMEKEGDVVQARIDAKFLEAACKGTTRYRIYTLDLHAKQLQFYLPNCIMDSAFKHYREHFPPSEYVYVFPDDGAQKRYKEELQSGDEYTFCYKQRGDNGERFIRLDNPSAVRGRKCVITDDLMRSGRTLISCAEQCKAEGAESVSAAFAHCACTQEQAEAFASKQQFESIVTTNSNPPSSMLLNEACNNITTISLAHILQQSSWL